MSTAPNFNAIARPYKYLEYLTLGPALQRCRTHHLGKLLNQRSALVLGDGDGRFLAQLLATNPHIHVEAVDTSRTMLDLLQANCGAASPTAATRLQAHEATAEAFLDTVPPTRLYDLVVTHFFLDCLTQLELEELVRTLKPLLAPNALWLVSDFRIPERGMARPLGRILVRALYLAFRVITGLRITQLSDFAAALPMGGLTRIVVHHSLGGLLTTELWQTAADGDDSK